MHTRKLYSHIVLPFLLCACLATAAPQGAIVGADRPRGRIKGAGGFSDPRIIEQRLGDDTARRPVRERQARRLYAIDSRQLLVTDWIAYLSAMDQEVGRCRCRAAAAASRPRHPACANTHELLHVPTRPATP